MSKVVVTGNPDNGEVINVSDNEQYGYIRTQQDREVIDEGTGWLRIKSISALVPGTVKDLERLGWLNGQTLPGRIIFREQMLPFNKKDPERDLKIAGETGVVCRVNGAPIYRKTFYSPREDAQDVPIQHDNVEEIKLAQASLDKVREKQGPDVLDL